VNAIDVNCTPWSVPEISGVETSSASSKASRQNPPSSVFDSRDREHVAAVPIHHRCQIQSTLAQKVSERRAVAN
jgi:hypothetical protein